MRDNFKIQKDKVALLIIDMQRHFCDPDSSFFVPQSNKLAEKLKTLVDSFSQYRRPIIFTRHIDSDKEDNLMLRWWSERIRKEDPMSEVVEILEPSRGTTIIKNQYDGFLHTELEKTLRDKGIRQVVICGVLTNLCCETTARSAFMRGFEVYFVKDGTATFNHAMHEASLLNLSYGFAVLTTIQDVIKILDLG
ncbi:MAG TPA: isochorismatase family cysteine hydrolase [Acidobacteriota bacterium]|nr:isochorismatase family cysteine hydrolase [Acidobacteriota bacterium]